MASLLEFDQDDAVFPQNINNPTHNPTSEPVSVLPQADIGFEEFSRTFHVSKLFVPHRVINMGMDIKFEDDAYNVRLNGLMSGEDYSQTVKFINEALLKCRATTVDHALLGMGPMLLPLIPWAIRQKQHKKQRRQIIERCVNDFNSSHPELFMRWQTRPEKQLIIMRRDAADREMNS